MKEGPDAYMRGIRAAHRKIDGASQPRSQGIARARTREARQVTIRESEQRLALYLRELGYGPVMQKAVDVYNVDLWVGDIAVEIYLGGRAQLDLPAVRRNG